MGSTCGLRRWCAGTGGREIYHGYDPQGNRRRIDPAYQQYPCSEFGYLTGAIRSLLAAVDTGSELWISGPDLRQALEVAIAATLSARRGSAPVRLALEDRPLSLYPVPYRRLGGNAQSRRRGGR